MRFVVKNTYGIVVHVFTTMDTVPDSDIREIEAYVPQPFWYESNGMEMMMYIDFDQQFSSGHRLHALCSADGHDWYARLNETAHDRCG